MGLVEMRDIGVENSVETVENPDFLRIYVDITSIIKEIY